MKNVNLIFIGDGSNEVASSFYHWIVDGGLEDSLIDTLSGEGIEVLGLKDFNNDTLEIAVESVLAVGDNKELASSRPCNVVLGAVIDEKEQPNTITVHGSVLVFGTFDRIEIGPAVQPAEDPRTLMLELRVIRRPGPMKGVCKPFSYQQGVTGRQYDQVKVHGPQDQQHIVPVNYLG